MMTHTIWDLFLLFAEMKLPITTTGEKGIVVRTGISLYDDNIIVNKSKSWTNRDYDQLTTDDDKGTRSASKHTLKMSSCVSCILCGSVGRWWALEEEYRGTQSEGYTVQQPLPLLTTRPTLLVMMFHRQVLKSFTHAWLGPMLELHGRMVGWHNVFYEFNWGSLSPQL